MKNAFKKHKLQLLSWIIAIAVLTAQLGTSNIASASQLDGTEITNEETEKEDTGEQIEEGISNDSDSSSGNIQEGETNTDSSDTKNDTSEEENTDTKTKDNIEPTVDEEEANSNETTIDEILTIAITDGLQAGTLLNTTSDLEAFENGVRQVLDQYYTEDINEQLSAFEEAIDERADEIVLKFKNAALEREQEGELNYLPGEIIVVLNENVDTNEVTDEIEESQAGTFQVVETIDETELAVVEISLEQTVEEAIAEYTQEESVAYAQPNFLYSLPENDFSTATTTDDPYATYEYQWHLTNIYAESAWDFMKKCSLSKVRVSVLDTGVDTSHPDLQETLNKNLCVDATTPALSKSTVDDDGHGTHVSGIIGATSNNGIGVAGVATGASNSVIDLMVVDVFTKSGSDLLASTSSIIRGLEYSQKNGAKVINLSLGFNQAELTPEDKELEKTINSITQKGILVVCAAGNGNSYSNFKGYDDKNLACYPSDFESVVSVIATDKNNKRAYFSNYGDAKDISAPGSNIVSTWKGAMYAESDGTSMASPIVAAVAAMALSVKPSLTPANLKSLLYSTSTDIYTSGWDRQSGHGVVNAYKVVTGAVNSGSATGITLSNNSIICGTSKTLKSILSPSYTTDSVTWTTSNSSVVAINSSTGKITAKKIGKVRITATTGSGKKTTCIVSVRIARPTISLRSTTHKRISIAWKKVSGAYRYVVTRATSKNGKYKIVRRTTGNTYTDKNVTLGKNYYYKVKAFAKNGSLTQTRKSAAFKSSPKVVTPKSLKAKATSKSRIRLTWKKVNGSTRYFVYRATSKKGRYKYIGRSTSTKYISKSLKSRRTYYYKVVAARTVGKNTYKSYRSSIISAKTK